MTQQYHASQLDPDTTRYLKTVSSSSGIGMPGIYSGGVNGWPIVALILGLIILVGTLFITLPPTEDPTKEAMLQTAGILFGGWCFLAAFRMWFAQAAGSRFGCFTYVDSQNLYQVEGTTVSITDLTSIQEAKVTQNMNDNTYKNSDVVIKLKGDTVNFTIVSEETGRRLAVYLNSLAYMRAGGDDGTDTQLQELNPIEMSSVAMHIAKSGNFPQNLASVDPVDITNIPNPQPSAGGGGSGFLGYIGILVAGLALFFGFKTYNEAAREDVIFNRIIALPAKDQPPGLRMYLTNEKFQKHREAAKTRLTNAYTNAATQFIKGNDPKLTEGLRMLFMSLAEKPQPVISLYVAEEVNKADSKNRNDTISFQLADKWSSTLGDELVSFVRFEDDTVKSMIDIRYKTDAGVTSYVVTFRMSPDEAPFQTVTGTIRPDAKANNFMVNFDAGLPDHILRGTCGLVVNRPIILPEGDF